ncbi:MAG TPA: hypothetical protein VN083_05000 [Vicinamibacteria bacterium]|nr:hypothetical protein [Vicinamibacteria bacterium]
MICSQCCGEKRRVEIDCPEDCVYLKGGHAPAWEGRETERKRDLNRLAPYIGALTEAQAQLFFATLAGIHEIRSRGELEDRTLAEAIQTLARSASTRSHGLIYEHAAGDPLAARVVLELKEFWQGLTKGDPLEIPELAKVLEAFASALEGAQKEHEGPRTFLDAATRLVRRHGLTVTPPREESRIVLPGELA